MRKRFYIHQPIVQKNYILINYVFFFPEGTKLNIDISTTALIIQCNSFSVIKQISWLAIQW